MQEATLNGAPPREYAAGYLAAGWSVISIRGDESKAPTLSGWKQYQTSRPTLADVNRWWLADNVGVGLIHGAVSGTEAIDIDRGDMFNPFVVEVEREAPGLIDKLTVIRTPRPGYHLIYKCESIEGSQKLAQYPNPDDPKKPKTLIETKGEGGYTLAPGSPGCCHETGGTYEHVDGPPLTEVSPITAAEREILFRVARSFNEFWDETPTTVSKPQGERGEGLSPGDDFNQRATFEEIIEPHGWTQSHGKYWRRPGKSNGWSATVGCTSQSGTELFCCFSDNAHPLTGATGRSPCTAYSKFALYATLNHGGDYSAAARRLRTEGYGDQPAERVFNGEDRFTTAPPKSEADAPQSKPRRRPIEKFTFAQLRTAYPKLSEPVIDGIARVGETLNLVADTKVGKSWMLYGLLLCVVTGRDWLGRFPTKMGKALLIDNELSRPVLAYRIAEVAYAMGIELEEYQDNLTIWPLRGNLRSIADLTPEFDDVEPGEYTIVGCDARYRFPIGGQGENDNTATTEQFNNIDVLADRSQSLWAMIHHTPKGNQGEKKITDVGAGAGAQSRAADAHLVVRPHEDEGVVVLDGVVRSFAPIEPLALKWDFPLWLPSESSDPEKLQGRLSGTDERQQRKDKEGCDAIVKALLAGPLTRNDVCTKAGMGKDRFNRLVGKLGAENQITTSTTKVAHNEAVLYQLIDCEEGVV